MPDASKTKAWFSRQVEENSDSLYSLAYRLTRNGTEAEDLVADCVTKAWTALPTLEDRSRFRPWIFRILHDRIISDYRKNQADRSKWATTNPRSTTTMKTWHPC